MPDLTKMMYHGTTDTFHDEMIRTYNRYRIVGYPVHLIGMLSSAMGYANQRSQQYNAKPLLLAVNPRFIQSRTELTDHTTVDFLLPEEFFTVDLSLYTKERMDSREKTDEFLEMLVKRAREVWPEDTLRP